MCRCVITYPRGESECTGDPSKRELTPLNDTLFFILSFNPNQYENTLFVTERKVTDDDDEDDNNDVD